jgi:hypothetical protein
MDNLGDWLYIIILAIAGISGLLSSGRKKKQTEERQRYPDVDGNMTEYSTWATTPETTQIPQPVKMAPRQKIPKTQLVSDSLLKGREKTIASIYSEQITEKDLPESHMVISGDDFQDIDELKKAIIYSEILNRKY